MKKIKFVIVSPRQKWGGSIVMHALCKYLIEEGYDAKIYYSQSCEKDENEVLFWVNHFKFVAKDMLCMLCGYFFNFLKISNRCYNGYVYQPVQGTKRKFTPFIDNDTVVVYSERMFGNPLKAKNVVRYMLYKTDMYKNPKSYAKEDLFFCYREVFDCDAITVQKKMLRISYFNLDLYKQTNFGKREGCCYVIRKGYDRKDLPSTYNGPIVDNMTEPQIVETFNKCERVYLYDMHTSYANIAALCGCLPISVLEHGKNKEDYFGKDDPQPFGRAFGDDEKEIKYAIETREALRERFDEQDGRNRVAVRKFIEECKKYFFTWR